jgi:hypothetical protein
MSGCLSSSSLHFSKDSRVFEKASCIAETAGVGSVRRTYGDHRVAHCLDTKVKDLHIIECGPDISIADIKSRLFVKPEVYRCDDELVIVLILNTLHDSRTRSP